MFFDGKLLPDRMLGHRTNVVLACEDDREAFSRRKRLLSMSDFAPPSSCGTRIVTPECRMQGATATRFSVHIHKHYSLVRVFGGPPCSCPAHRNLRVVCTRRLQDSNTISSYVSPSPIVPPPVTAGAQMGSPTKGISHSRRVVRLHADIQQRRGHGWSARPGYPGTHVCRDHRRRRRGYRFLRGHPDAPRSGC